MESPSSDAVLDFLARLASDRLAGEVEPLARYLERYPGHEEQVAAEYLRATRPAPEEPGPGGDGGPARIGPYHLVRELGRGGQAVVWLAEDPRLGRRVALKVVPRAPGADELSPRFSREARATAGLQHPNVCALYEAGVDGSSAWIAMQYVEGQTLAEWLAARADERGPGTPPGPAELERILPWTEKVARALHAAHGSGVVHRDVKPANVMVQEGGEPVVLDFGVALLDDEGPALTRTGTSLGTPAYMSPEQLGDGRAPVGRATDVWSLGATLYEACTGRRPFEGPSWDALVRAVLHEEPPDPRGLSPHVSRDLAAVLETALCKELGGRYATAEELADDLGRVQRGEPTTARPLGRARKLARWARRNPVVAGLTAAVVVVGLAGTAATLQRNRALSSSNAELLDSNARLARKTEEAERSSRRAEAEARARAAALAEYERMADARRLADARREADALFPVHPDLVPRLLDWQRRHAPLLARLPSHEAALEALRADALPWDEEARRRDYAAELDLAERLRAALPGVRPDARPTLQARIDALEANTTARRSWDFGDDVDRQFRHDALLRLTDELRAFTDPEGGVVADVEERLALSRRVRAETVDRHAAEWEDLRARVAANPAYRGLDVPPQVGLVPLGPDPRSGLEELLVWQTQPDAVPRRDADGRLLPEDGTGVVLVLVPSGTYLMGAQASDAEGPNHDPGADPYEEPVVAVELDAFLVSKFELTQGQWLRAEGSNPSSYEAGYSSVHLRAPIDLRHPVETVSWLDCAEALRRLGLELPTEAQWEYAARAGADTVYTGTSDLRELRRFANIAGAEVEGVLPNFSPEHVDPFVVHAPVGSFEPNAFGLHDTTGNVWEWVRDRFASYHVVPRPGDGERPSFSETRVYRGGAATARAPDQRVAKRTEINADLRYNALGVRPARRLSR